MRRVNKDMVVFGAVFAVAIMISAVTVVAQVHSEPLMDYIEKSQQNGYENNYEMDREKTEDLQAYMADFFDGTGSGFRDFYENSDKVVALNDSLTVLIDEIWDTCEDYFWYLEHNIWTEEQFMETAGYYIVNKFVDFFETNPAVMDLINDDDMAYFQELFEEGVNDTLDDAAVVEEEYQVGNGNLLGVLLEFLRSDAWATDVGDDGVLDGLSITEMESNIQSLSDDPPLCPIAVFLCSLLFACCLILCGEKGILAQLCTYIVCCTILAGPVLMWDYVACTIIVGGAFVLAMIAKWIVIIDEASNRGLFGLAIVTIVATFHVLMAPLRWVAILLLAFLLQIFSFQLGYYMELIDSEILIAWEWALEWYRSWNNVGVPQGSQDLEETERFRVFGVVENLLYSLGQLLSWSKPVSG